MNQNYANWESQVKKDLIILKSELDGNDKAKELYNGFYIWDSKFMEEPDIMFIGINPGDGNPNNDKSVKVIPEESMSYLEYWDEGNTTYTIAKETIEVFEKAGYSEAEIRNLLNEQSVKTNFYYIITKNQDDIGKCLNSVQKGKFKEFWLMSFKWTSELIKIVNPKAIICEGKNAFDEITAMMALENIKWENDCAVTVLPDNNLVIIGYKRKYSNILNKTKLAELIKNYIK